MAPATAFGNYSLVITGESAQQVSKETTGAATWKRSDHDSVGCQQLFQESEEIDLDWREQHVPGLNRADEVARVMVSSHAWAGFQQQKQAFCHNPFSTHNPRDE